MAKAVGQEFAAGRISKLGAKNPIWVLNGHTAKVAHNRSATNELDASAEPRNQEVATMQSRAGTTVAEMRQRDPSITPVLDNAYAYAVFPEVGKAGFIAGGSYGKGEVFEGGKKIGYADITQATFGLQAGAQTFDELLVFMRRDGRPVLLCLPALRRTQ